MPKGYNVFSTFNPEQQRLFSQLIGSLQGAQGNIQQQPTFESGQNFLQQLLGGDTSKFEAPLMRQFQEQIIPQLAERFSGAGAGAQSSSAFKQALGASGADLAERLGSLRGQLQLGALGPALQYAQAPVSNLQNILGMSTQAFAPKPQSFGKSLATNIAGGLSTGLGSLSALGLTGGLSGAGGLLGLLGNLFKKQQGSFINPQGQITGKMY